jgi:hypothetical protein
MDLITYEIKLRMYNNTMAKKLAANMPKWAGKLPIFTYNALAVLMQ